MEKRNLELRVGIVAILAILIVLLGSIWGKDIKIGSAHNEVAFSFKNSGGMRPGDPVTVNGVKKGRINDIKLDQKRVLVYALLDQNVTLYEDVQASIEMLDLMGGSKLEIYPGDSPRPLNLDTLSVPIRGKHIVGIGELIEDAYDLKMRVDTVITETQSVLRTVSRFADEQRVIRPIYASIRDLRAMTQRLRIFVDENETQFSDAIANLHNTSKSASSLLTANRKNLEGSIHALHRITTRLDTFSIALSSVSAQLNRREGTVAKLVYDDSTYNRLQQTIERIDSLAVDVRTNLGKYLQGADIKFLNLVDF